LKRKNLILFYVFCVLLVLLVFTMNYVRQSTRSFLVGGASRRMFSNEKCPSCNGRFRFDGSDVCWGFFWVGLFGYLTYDLSLQKYRIDADREVEIARAKYQYENKNLQNSSKNDSSECEF